MPQATLLLGGTIPRKGIILDAAGCSDRHMAVSSDARNYEDLTHSAKINMRLAMEIMR
jgi:hypothetical protein